MVYSAWEILNLLRRTHPENYRPNLRRLRRRPRKVPGTKSGATLMQRAITGAALITTRRTHKNGTVDRSCAGNERFRLSDCSLRSRNTFLDRVNGCATVSLHGNVLIIFVETRLNQNMPPTFLLLVKTLRLSPSFSVPACELAKKFYPIRSKQSFHEWFWFITDVSPLLRSRWIIFFL